MDKVGLIKQLQEQLSLKEQELDFKVTELKEEYDTQKYINELLDSGTEDRIGLMVFSSDSELLVPVTHDYAAVSFFLESMYPGMIGKGGTDIGTALVAGIKSFDDTDFSNKKTPLPAGKGVFSCQKPFFVIQ